jgi:hypothetical protein
VAGHLFHRWSCLMIALVYFISLVIFSGVQLHQHRGNYYDDPRRHFTLGSANFSRRRARRARGDF